MWSYNISHLVGRVCSDTIMGRKMVHGRAIKIVVNGVPRPTHGEQWSDLFGKKREGTNVLLGSSGTCLIIVQLTPPSRQSTKLPLPGSHTSQLLMLLMMRTCLQSCLQGEKFMAL